LNEHSKDSILKLSKVRSLFWHLEEATKSDDPKRCVNESWCYPEMSPIQMSPQINIIPYFIVFYGFSLFMW